MFIKTLKIKFSNTLLYSLIKRTYHQIKYLNWLRKGSPIPLHHIFKEKFLKKMAIKHEISCLIETGTYQGTMIEAVKKNFRKIISIEVSPMLFNEVKNKFKEDKNVRLILGDSSVVLNDLMPEIQEQVLFWLDAHCSEGITSQGKKYTPILDELDIILTNENFRHVIVIDDARLFGSDPNYPTIDEVKSTVFANNRNYSVVGTSDFIVIE